MNPNDLSLSQRIIDSIYAAFDEVNETLTQDRKIPKSLETRLLGEDGAIDSLGLTILIVAIERQIEDRLRVTISLVNEQAMSEESSPFRSVKFLAEYIESLMKGSNHA